MFNTYWFSLVFKLLLNIPQYAPITKILLQNTL